MFTPEQKEIIEREAERLGLEPAALMAVAEVESGGRVHAVAGGRTEPLIRFEGHYFDRLLPPHLQEKARALALASPLAGAIANPPSQAARWALLERAAALDEDAAYAATSWGIGQVMGDHWRWLGYDSVGALVEEARSGFAGQLRLMLAYIERAGLIEPLRRHDWRAFARGYNGPAYARHGYHTRLAAAYRRHTEDGIPEVSAAGPRLLRLGDGGADVAELQRRLAALEDTAFMDPPLAVDGVFGPRTLAAVERLQRAAGLAVDGVAGPLTLAALDERVAQPRWFTTLFDWFSAFWRVSAA